MLAIIKEYRRRRAAGATIRPIWQIAIFLPLKLIVMAGDAAETLADTLDERLNPTEDW